MSWNVRVRNSEGGDFEKAPPGNHPAVCVGIIGMGTTDNVYQGQVNGKKNAAFFVYELVGEKTTQGKNHLLGIDLNISMGKKAKLRKFVEARTGKSVPADGDYDIMQELGQPCLLNVVLNDNGYPKIDGVGSLPKGMTVPAPENKPVAVPLADHLAGTAIPSWVPWLFGKSIEDHIAMSDEVRHGSPQDVHKATNPDPRQSAAPPANRPAPPPRPGQRPAPALSGKWLVIFKDGDEPVELEAASIPTAISGKGLNPETVLVWKEGEADWKDAKSVGLSLPF